VKLLRLILILILSLTAYASAFNIDGSLATSYEVSKNEGESSEGLWENYLSIDNAKLLDPYLGLTFYGRYSYDESIQEDYTDIYSAYLDYSSFQKALEVRIGRFSYIANRFLTLDGAQVTFRTDFMLGATAFAGVPEYYDSDGRHINESFRDTGDRLYGAKVFLNGVKDTTGFISYSKEEEDDVTFQEMLGLGAGYRFNVSDISLHANGSMQYDMDSGVIYKGAAKLHMKYGKLRVNTDFITYNVKDGSTYEDELIISNFSSGKQDKYALYVQYDVTKNIAPYWSAVYSRMEMGSGLISKGEIYKLGSEFNYFKEFGIISGLEGYIYSSDISNAKGGSFDIDWSVTRAFRMNFESEMLRVEQSFEEKTIYSLYLRAEYDLLKDFTISVYAENNQETRYLPENRYGLKAVYSF